jgi:hypothetical protein
MDKERGQQYTSLMEFKLGPNSTKQFKSQIRETGYCLDPASHEG